MGQQFSYNGQDYTGVINILADKQTIQVGGYDVSLTAQVTVAKDSFPQPVMGARITIGGKVRRIVAVDEDQISWTLHLDEVNR